MTPGSRTLLIVAALVLLAPAAAEAVLLGQSDTFQDGTTLGWFVPGPSPNPPISVPDGGPAGLSDGYLSLSANGGSAPGSRMSVLNGGQWMGDYLTAGVTHIRMDVNNFGPEDLALRLLFERSETGPPTDLALSADAVIVPTGSGWVTVDFPIGPADLVVETLGSVVGALSQTTSLRLFHNPAAAFSGPGTGAPPVTATLGVDNITALPEPATLSLLLVGGLLALLLRRRGTR